MCSSPTVQRPSLSEIESYLRKAKVIDERGISGDLPMDRSNIGDSSTRHNTQPAISRNTRELATSLVEMKIALRDLPMLEAGAFQGKDYQQPPRDASNSLNLDPPSFYPLVWKDFHVDPMNVDDLPGDPPANVGDEADSAEERLLDAKGQVQVCEEAPLTGEGDAQQEQSNPSLEDLSMTEVHEEAPLTGEGVSQEEQCDPSSEDLPMTEASPADSVDSGVTEEPSNPSPLRVIAVVPFILPSATTQPEETS